MAQRTELDVLAAAWAADRELSELSTRARFLLYVTPTNAPEAFESFKRSGYRATPDLKLRPLDFEVAEVKRELYEIDLAGVTDDVLAHLLAAKRDELDRTFTLLGERGTERFRLGSMELYGSVEDELVAAATAILHGCPPPPESGTTVTAADYEQRAQAELEAYRAVLPELTATVEVRDDMTGLMVLSGDLLIGAGTETGSERLEPLIEHEIGVHALTYANGLRQPLQLLATGLAGYEQTQEALGVFAEYMAGGLDPARLHLLALRVIAARRMSERAGFPEVFAELRDRGAPERAAWTTTMRAFRCGGTTKDAIYLRGLLELLTYLETGRAIEPLLVGKMPLTDVPLVEELLERGVLEPPALIPRWLERPGAPERLERARSGIAPLELVCEGAA